LAGFNPSAGLVTSLLVPPADTPRRVLLVDDKEDALDRLSTFVESAGHNVIIAHDLH
jgi:hypothetical protein